MERLHLTIPLTLATLPLAVAAQQSGGSTDREAGWQAWSEMRERLVSVEEILDGDVSNGINPVGQVTNLVLTPAGDQVQYVLFETPYPYSFYTAEDGFVSFERIDLQRGAALDFDIVLDEDVEALAPEEIEITATEAENRLVTNLIGARLAFPDNLERIVEDILIDRHTGEITHWVVEMEPDTLFLTEPRTIPATEVSIEEGDVSTTMAYADVDAAQEFDPDML